jgi:prolyl-tRNA synthetase
MDIKKEINHGVWWNKLITEGDLVDIRFKIKGFFVWKPYGFQVMKNIKKIWDELFEQEDIHETYFPLFVPKEYALQNESWWNSFQEQAFYVNGFFDQKKDIFIRPTGEPAMYPIFKLWIRSYRNLPLRIYETVSSFRNETNATKAFVRDVEIGPWYEIHTCHATAEEANNEIELAIKLNEKIFDLISIARLKVRKPKYDCFPGSIGAVEFYTILNDGLLENGSCNNLGQAYAKAFGITFKDSEEKDQFVWQTCTGNGERFLGAIIENHSDEKGLFLPPSIAPIVVSVILITIDDKIISKLDFGISKKRTEIIKIKSFSDLGEIRFSNEKKGIPVRIEIGPNEIKSKKVTICLRNGEKIQCPFNKIKKIIKIKLEEMQQELMRKSKEKLELRIKDCKNLEELKETNIGISGWCGSQDCAGNIKYTTGKDLIGMTFNVQEKECIWCKKKGEKTIFAKGY